MENLNNDVENAIILDSLMYIIPDMDVNNKSVTRILAEIERGDYVLNEDNSLRFDAIKDAISENKTYWNDVKISNASWDNGFDSGTAAAAFTDGNGNLTVAFKGTGGGEWLDNSVAFSGYGDATPTMMDRNIDYLTQSFEGRQLGFLSEGTGLNEGHGEIVSIQQDRSVDYFDYLAKSYNGTGFTPDLNITLTGHSKGGNKAQYITMTSEYGAYINKCISVDGPNFSYATVEAMKNLYGIEYYEMQRDKLYSFNGNNDFVHNLGNECIIPQEHINHLAINYDRGNGNFADNHEIHCLFDEDGRIVFNAEQGSISIWAQEYSDFISRLPPHIQNQCARLIMQIIELDDEDGYIVGLDGRRASIRDLLGFLSYGLQGMPLIYLKTKENDLLEYLDSIVNKLDNSILWYINPIEMACFTIIAKMLIAIKPIESYSELVIFLINYPITDLPTLIKNYSEELGKMMIRELIEIITVIKQRLPTLINNINHYNGIKYATENPNIEINTELMINYSNRLKHVYNNLYSISNRMSSLYTSAEDYKSLKSMRDDLRKILQEYVLEKCNVTIKQCIDYLDDTTNLFVETETKVLNATVII